MMHNVDLTIVTRPTTTIFKATDKIPYNNKFLKLT